MRRRPRRVAEGAPREREAQLMRFASLRTTCSEGGGLPVRPPPPKPRVWSVCLTQRGGGGGGFPFRRSR